MWRPASPLPAETVIRSKQFTRQGKSLGFGPPKSTKSIRTIDLDEETVELLREQYERQRFERRAWARLPN